MPRLAGALAQGHPRIWRQQAAAPEGRQAVARSASRRPAATGDTAPPAVPRWSHRRDTPLAAWPHIGMTDAVNPRRWRRIPDSRCPRACSTLPAPAHRKVTKATRPSGARCSDASGSKARPVAEGMSEGAGAGNRSGRLTLNSLPERSSIPDPVAKIQHAIRRHVVVRLAAPG